MAPQSKEQFETMREISRVKILATTLDLFSKKGFDNTSISDIAKAAGISKGLTYNYFKSKDDLLEQTLEMLMQKVTDVFKPSAAIENPKERLEFLIRTNFKLIELDSSLWRMFIQLSLQLDKESNAHKILNMYWSMLFNNAIEIFKEIGYTNYKSMAYQYGAMMDGLAMQYILLGKENFPFEETLENVIQLFCK